MGVFSVLGNHDYGDYKMWPSEQHKKQNLATLKQHHATLGWRLLMDEHVVLKKGNDELAVIGIQNWGAKVISRNTVIYKKHILVQSITERNCFFRTIPVIGMHRCSNNFQESMPCLLATLTECSLELKSLDSSGVQFSICINNGRVCIRKDISICM